jgi:HTH-type transcriptional regulator / antitoxin HipB
MSKECTGDCKTLKKAAREENKKSEKKKVKESQALKLEKIDYELRIDLLGDAIKSARKERNMTQKELGQLVGVKKAQISKIENSLTDARFETIIKVFKALNVKINFNVELMDQTVSLD